MEDTHDAFEQVECEYPSVQREVREWTGDTENFRIEWDDGTSRETSLAGLAFYAENWDDTAEVTRLD